MTAPKVIEFRSEHSETVLYACSLCGLVIQGNTREQAERCCLCIRCARPVDRRFRTMCDICDQVERAAKEVRQRDKALARAAVEHDGPVYVEDTDRFYEDAAAAAEALWDDGKDPTTALVHPCAVGPLPVPDITTYVDEAWGDEFGDGYWDGLTADAARALAECVEKLGKVAPTIWTPLTEKRVQLPAITEAAV